MAYKDLEKKAATDRAYRLAHKEEQAAYYREHQEKIKARSRAWNKNNSAKKAVTNRAWYEANRERIIASVRAWRAANPEKQPAYSRAYNRAHTAENNARRRAWNEANPGREAAYARAYRLTHKEEAAATARAWAQANPEKRATYVQNYQARKREVFVEAVDRARVFKRDKGICGICGQLADPNDWHLDHIQPLSREGKHSYDNVRVTHPKCNQMKSGKLDSEIISVSPLV